MFSRYTKIRFFIVVTICIVVAGLFILFRGERERVTTFDECVRKGHGVLASFPRQCIDADGDVHVENIGNALEMQDRIQVASPEPNTIILQPLIIEGVARSDWFKNNSFLVEITDADGTVLGAGIAMQQSELQLDDFRRFSAKVDWRPDETSATRGFVLLKKGGGKDEGGILRLPVLFHLEL